MKKWSMLVFLVSLWVVASACHKRADSKPDLAQWMQIESEALEDYDLHSVTEHVTTNTYSNANGDKIICYLLKTSLYDEASQPEGVNTEALMLLFEPMQMERSKDLEVNGGSAVLYTGEGHAYLCWGYSQELTCVIEYDPTAVTQADIIRMAEGITVE